MTGTAQAEESTGQRQRGRLRLMNSKRAEEGRWIYPCTMLDLELPNIKCLYGKPEAAQETCPSIIFVSLVFL